MSPIIVGAAGISERRGRGQWVGAPPTTPLGATGNFAWSAWHAYDGGHENTVDVCRYAPQYQIAGTDVAGIGFTANEGLDWLMENGWIANTGERCVASVKYGEDGINYNGLALALCGDGSGGCALLSNDFGRTWPTKTIKTGLFGHGNNTTIKGLPGDGTYYTKKHPRRVGDMIAIDHINGLAYFATHKNGIMRVPLATFSIPSTWETIGFGGSTYYSSSLIFGRNADGSINPNVLYYAEHSFGDPNNGIPFTKGDVWRCNNPRDPFATVVWDRFTNANAHNVEELVAIGIHVLGVTSDETKPGNNKVLRLPNAETCALSTLWVPLTTPITSWQIESIGGFKDTDGSSHVLVTFTTEEQTGTQPFMAFGHSTDDFLNSVWEVEPQSYSTQVVQDNGGPGGHGSPFEAAVTLQGKRGPFGHGVIYSRAGRRTSLTGGRPFRCWNTDAAQGTKIFYPSWDGIQMLNARDLSIDPYHPERYWWAGLDSCLVSTDDGGITPIKDKPPGALSPGSGDASAVCHNPFMADVSGGVDIYAFTGWGNTGGSAPGGHEQCEGWRATTPYNKGTRVWSQIKNATNALGSAAVSEMLVTGCKCVQDSAGDVWLIALVRGSGPWRQKIMTGGVTITGQPWQLGTVTAVSRGPLMKAAVGIGGVGQQKAEIANVPGSPIVTVVDRALGLWVSTDAGANWHEIVDDHPNKEGQGFVECIYSDPTKVILSKATDNKVYMIQNIDTVGTDLGTGPLLLDTMSVPGPVAVDQVNGLYYIMGRFAQPPLQMLEATLANPTNFIDKSDSLLKGIGWSPSIMRAGHNRGYIGFRGNGVAGWVRS